MKKRIWLVVATLVALVAAMAASAQEMGVYRCGTGDLLCAMEKEAARTAAEEAAAKAVMEKERVAALAREKKGLVLHYAFGKGGEWGTGSVVKDLSGEGHDGTVEGDGLEVVRGIGKRGKAVRFDGKGDYIRVPRDEALEPDEITVAAWVKVREGFATCGGDGIGAVVFKRNTGFHDNEDYCLEIHPGRLLRTDLSSPRGGHVKVTTREALEPELWHHVTVTVGGGMARIYVDGTLAVEQIHEHPFAHSRRADLFVGARDHTECPMGRFGAFDLFELKIWDEVLGAEQVAALYRERAGHFGVAKRETKEKKGLVLHYAFGKGGEWGTGSVVKDLSGGGHDGRVEGDGLDVAKGLGNRGKAARFDGKGDFIRVPRNEALEGAEITVAAWVKVREDDAWENGATIAFKRNSSFNHNEGYCLEIFPDRTVRATVSGPNAAQCRMQSTMPMEDGIWHHVAMVHAPGDTRLYVDGALAGEGQFPQEVVHNSEADLLIAGRDHAQYPTDRFGMFDLAEVKVWNEALGTEQIGLLYRERAGRTGVGESASAQSAVVEFGSERRLTWKGIEPEPKVFPAWEPEKKNTGRETGLATELRALVEQGRRDKAASPEFLDALDGLFEKYRWTEGGCAKKPSDKLPLKPEFRGPWMPAGWDAVKRDVWRFGDGEARQVESKANTRYVLFYEPGMEWKDYEATFCFESDKWFQPPARSSAVLYFRYHDIDDSYSVWMDGAGDLSLISLDKERHGAQRYLAWVPVDRAIILDGKPWTVKVRGEKIEIWHEGKRMLFATDRAHPSGTVGLESVHIPMRFSGVVVSGEKGE